MGIVGRLVWTNTYRRKQFRSLVWRIRAALKRAIKNGGKQQLRFQYDPYSYALNFDDGCCRLEHCTLPFTGTGTPQYHSDIKNTMWVYILWVKSE